MHSYYAHPLDRCSSKTISTCIFRQQRPTRGILAALAYGFRVYQAAIGGSAAFPKTKACHTLSSRSGFLDFTWPLITKSPSRVEYILSLRAAGYRASEPHFTTSGSSMMRNAPLAFR